MLLKDVHHYPFIRDLEPENKEVIVPYLHEQEYRDGDIILEQGQESDRFYILLSGLLQIHLEKKLRVSVAQLEPGQCFGEMSCLTGERVSATVKVKGTARILSMPKEGLLKLMDGSASFRKHMLDALIQRIHTSNERVLQEHTRSFVVTRQLEEQRQSQRRELVGSSLLMQRLRKHIEKLSQGKQAVCIAGEKGVGKQHVAYEIHHLSAHRNYPCLQIQGADFSLEDWELKVEAARGGTVILNDADLLPADLLRRLIHETAGTRLVMTAQQLPDVQTEVIEMPPLRERTEDIPELVADILSREGVAAPHEVVAQDAMRMLTMYPYMKQNVEELEQVVQRALVLSGGNTIRVSHLRFGGPREPGARPKIGLALGSGSARGAAHVGVLKVLEEESIPIDMIAGTSVGAFIGALYAGGQPVSAFERVLPTVRWRQLVRFFLSRKAFVDNQPMIRFVEKYIGPVDFQDLSIPFAAMASDAITGEAHILNKGRVSHAICASTAIPGIMKPVAYNNRLLLDGAVAHPIPVALAKSMGADIVIAVDVGVSPAAKDAPKSWISTILNTIEIMSERLVQEELQLADVVVHPHLHANQISFKASSDLIRLGEKAARDAIVEIHSKFNS